MSTSGVLKVNGGVMPGIWVEQEVQFVKIVFDEDISSSSFDLPNSVLDKAIRLVQQRGTVLGVSELYDGGTTVDVMLGFAQGHFAAEDDGVIIDGLEVVGVDCDGAEFSAEITVTFAKFAELPVMTAGDLREFRDGEFRPAFDYGADGTDYCA